MRHEHLHASGPSGGGCAVLHQQPVSIFGTLRVPVAPKRRLPRSLVQSRGNSGSTSCSAAAYEYV